MTQENMSSEDLCEKIGNDEAGPAFRTFFVEANEGQPGLTRCSADCPYGLNNLKPRLQIGGEGPVEPYCPVNGDKSRIPGYLAAVASTETIVQRQAI